MVFWTRARGAARGDEQAAASAGGFDAAAYALLARRVDAALRKARRLGRGVVASVTVGVPAGIDPLPHVEAARAVDEPWSAFEHPARDGFALATLGAAATVRAEGAGRFGKLARACGSALEAAELDERPAPAGSGVIWTGGFAFYADRPWGDAWRDTPAAEFVLPVASLCRTGGDDPQARLTLTALVEPDASAAAILRRIEDVAERLALSRDLGGQVFTPRPGAAHLASVAPPEHFERAVGEAAAAIRAGEIEKLVLAREVVLRRDAPIDVFAALRGLRERFPECVTFAIGRADTTFLGATPELLIRREGRRASTIALAGSIRRGADPETDRHLGRQLLASAKDNEEHAIVARRIERTLGRLSAWVAVGERPELVKVKNIQHLATPIRAQLTEPRPVIELAGLLHPTPAVGGEPWPDVADRIKALEGFDRGWYTGGVGWMDLFEDGEFHVALRSALVQGDHARLFAGAGIVGDSAPAAELAETEIKLAALAPVLSES